jgi:Ni/Co efflux regulator RcnB
MRKLILLAAAAAVLVPGAAVAQRQEVRQDRREVRHDRQELRHDRRELRHDRRETRRDMRKHRRSAYVAPYRNWNYRPVTVGYRLQSPFYGSRYYINDYGAYHLRAPGRYQRWIRYGNDLLLVNVRTGRVLQVIHYRYW